MSVLVTRLHHDSSIPFMLRSMTLLLQGVYYAGWLVLCVTAGWLLFDGNLSHLDLSTTILPIADMIGPDQVVGWKTEIQNNRGMIYDGSMVLRALLFRIAVWTLLATTLLKCISLFLLDRKYRGTRSLFGLIAYVAIWLSLVTQSNSIIEYGRAFRIEWQSNDIQSFASSINYNWDSIVSGEGYTPIGYVNPYPFGKPTLLMMLGEQQIPQTSIYFNAIERSCDKTIRFELTRSNLGYWLEVRQDGREPMNFTGGLFERYTMIAYRKLRNGIHLVRYHTD